MAEIGTEATLPLYERSGLASAAIFGDLAGIADRRTLEILERRRTSNPHRRGWLVRRLLVLADVVGLVLAFVAVELVFGAGAGAGNRATSVEESLLLLATLPGWIVIAKLYRLYDQDEERTHHPTTDDFSGVFHLVTVGVWLFFAGTWAFGIAHPDLSKLIAFWAAAIGLVTLARACARRISRHSLSYLQNTIIVGAGDVGQQVARKLLRHPEYGINLVGFVDSHPLPRQDGLDQVALLGPSERLPELVRLLDVERIVIAFSSDSSEETLALVRSLEEVEVQIDIVPRLFELVEPDASRSTRSRACRSSSCLRGGSRRRHARSSARSTSSARRVLLLLTVAAVRLHRLAREARLAGAGVLPADAARPLPARVHGAQVPDNADRRRRRCAPGLHPSDDGPARPRRP